MTVETLRVLVADDEPAALDLLAAMLEAEPGVEVVGRCRDGLETKQWLERRQADVVFLDVRMPELDGFEAIEGSAPERRPPVVFVTASEEFATRAFDFDAWDYLLKPFDTERLRQTLERVRERLGSAPPAIDRRLTEALDRLEREPIQRFAVKQGRGRRTVQVDQVDWIAAESNYARLHVGESSHLTRTSLAALESKLDPRRFVRIHRSTIVNVERIERIEAIGHGDLTIELTGGHRLQVSRRYRQKLEELVEPLA